MSDLFSKRGESRYSQIVPIAPDSLPTSFRKRARLVFMDKLTRSKRGRVPGEFEQA